MIRAFKLFGFVAATLLLFIAVALVAFYHLIQIGELRRFLISQIEDKTDLRVQLGEADLEIGWILGISFRDVALSVPESPQPAMTARRVTARIALLPLLNRQVVFYQIRLAQPSARMERDKDGNIPLLDRLLNLPFLKEERDAISLDLRNVGVEKGDIDFIDQLAKGGPATTHFRGIDLELERIRGQALRDFFRNLVRVGGNRPPGAALDFSWTSDVERDGQRTTLRAKGKIVFPEQKLEFQKAWWDATVQLMGAPTAMVEVYAGGQLPIKSSSGSITTRLRVEGNRAERVRVKGEVAFGQLVIDAPEYFAAPLFPGDGVLELDIDWTPRRLEIAQAALRSKEMWLSLRGEVRAGDNRGTHLRLELSAPWLPVAIIRKYLPLRLPGLAHWEAYAAAFQQGEIHIQKAGLDASLSGLNQVMQGNWDERIWIDAELRNLAGNLSGGYFPIRGVQGRITLEKGVLAVRDLKGEYGHSRVSDLDGSYRAAAPGHGRFEFHALGEVDLAEMREQLRSGVLGAPTMKLASAISEMGGRGKIDLVLRGTADSPLQFEGKVLLDNARLRVDDLSLTELRGELTLTPQEIRTQKLRSLISGSPVQVQLALKDYGGDGSFDLEIESTGMKAGVVTQMLLGTGSLLDRGVVRGAVRYHGPLASKEGRKFTGNLDLINVQLQTPPLLQPLRELNGRIRINETGVDFQNLKGLLAGFPAHFSGRWRYGQRPHLFFDFLSPNLDISYLISQIDPEASAFYANLHAVGKVSIAQGKFKTFEFTDLKTDLVLDRRVWRLSQVSTRSAGGAVQGTGTIADKPDTLGLSIESKIQGVPVEGFLNWLETKTTEMTGKVSLSGSLESLGRGAAERKRNLNGALSVQIDEGTIHRLRILVQILNLLDLSRWFTLQVPDLSKQGIRFRSITGDFKVAKGVFFTQNLLVDSDDLRMSGAGSIDLPNDQIDFVVAVRPFAGMDTAINYIPLIGRGIAAIKNSFLVASFNIKGPIDDPTITPAPLSTLSEVFFGVLGIPKKLIPVGPDEKKSEPQKNQQEEPASDNVPAPIP
jgi:uncharacterized protein YhdP